MFTTAVASENSPLLNFRKVWGLAGSAKFDKPFQNLGWGMHHPSVVYSTAYLSKYANDFATDNKLLW